MLSGVRTAGAAQVASRDWSRWRALPRRLYGWAGNLAPGRFRRMVAKALALPPRGFVARDVLRLDRLSVRLRIEWRTRDIHPWDDHLPAPTRAELFRDQTLRDTDAAVVRLFETFPEADAIEIRVLEPCAPHRALFAGTVKRRDALAARALASPAMRLNAMGIRSGDPR